MQSAAYAASATRGPRSPPASASPARPRNSGGGGAIDDAVHQRDPRPGGPERAAERANPDRAHSTVDGADLVDAQGPGAARVLDRPVLVPHRPGRGAAVAVRQVRLGRTGGPAGWAHAGACGWAFAHRASFLRFGFYPALGRWRRWCYRRRWYPAMATAKLAVVFDRRTVVPVLKCVRCRPGADELLVRMVTGQIPDDFAKVAERLAHTFAVRSVKAMPGLRPDVVVLVLLRGDPLLAVVAPLPVPAVPDFTALPVAKREDGGIYALRLFGTQVLIVGATGSG